MVPVWIQIVTGVATMIVMVALAVLVLGAIPAVFVIRRQIQKTGEEVSKAASKSAPLLQQAVDLLGELKGMATDFRTDAQLVHRLAKDADANLREHGQRAQARLAELDAALGVLRDGLEDAVVSVAAVAHGVRAGTAALGLSHNGRKNGDDHAGSPGRRAQPRVRGQRREE
jgi:uncharacterized protein YoxC